MTNIRLRPEVLAFAYAMERRLRENDRGGWKCDCPGALHRLLLEEAEELRGVLVAMHKRHDVLSKAADVANFAMMVADVAGNLPGGCWVESKEEQQAKRYAANLEVLERIEALAAAGNEACAKLLERSRPA